MVFTFSNNGVSSWFVCESWGSVFRASVASVASVVGLYDALLILRC